MDLKDFYADRVIDFIKKYAVYIIKKIPKPQLKTLIRKHLEYNTIVILWDGPEIVGVTAFNVEGTEAKISECVVHPAYRFKNILKKMTIVALSRYGYLKTISFERGLRNGKKHFLDIQKFLKIPATQ